MVNRRGFLAFLGGAMVAPVVVRAEALMPLRGYRMLPFVEIPKWCPPGWVPCNGRELGRAQFPELYDRFRRLRAYGAHESDESFTMPFSPPYGANYYNDTYQVPIMSATDMFRSNGVIMEPGAIHGYEVTRLQLEESPGSYVKDRADELPLWRPHDGPGYGKSLNIPGEGGLSRRGGTL